jgi:hypothetical protein
MPNLLVTVIDVSVIQLCEVMRYTAQTGDVSILRLKKNVDVSSGLLCLARVLYTLQTGDHAHLQSQTACALHNLLDV